MYIMALQVQVRQPETEPLGTGTSRTGSLNRTGRTELAEPLRTEPAEPGALTEPAEPNRLNRSEPKRPNRTGWTVRNRTGRTGWGKIH